MLNNMKKLKNSNNIIFSIKKSWKNLESFLIKWLKKKDYLFKLK